MQRYETLLKDVAIKAKSKKNPIHLEDEIYSNLLHKAAHMLTQNELMENWASEHCEEFLWRSFILNPPSTLPANVDPKLAMDQLKFVMSYARSDRGQKLESYRVNYVFISAIFENLPMIFTFM